MHDVDRYVIGRRGGVPVWLIARPRHVRGRKRIDSVPVLVILLGSISIYAWNGTPNPPSPVAEEGAHNAQYYDGGADTNAHSDLHREGPLADCISRLVDGVVAGAGSRAGGFRGIGFS